MKFMPLYKNKVWGGNKIKTLGFDYEPLANCGEMWLLSSVEGNESVIANGFLEGNTINEALEIYMGDLIGERNYDRYGNTFPLLIKIIDTADKLSIQVHPDDDLARRRGMDNGKSEMWYIMETESGAEIVDGFSRKITADEYRCLIDNDQITTVLHSEQPSAGDVFYIPAGRVHALGSGLLLAEIQQTSDCTYRLYDYHRPDSNGELRQLHTQEALEALDFTPTAKGRTEYNYRLNATTGLVECPYFTTNLIAFDKPLRKDLSQLETFVVYLCTDGIMAVRSMDEIIPLHAGECVMLPATADGVELFSEGTAKVLEVYVDPELAPNDGVSHGHDNDWIAQFMGMDTPMMDLDDDEG